MINLEKAFSIREYEHPDDYPSVYRIWESAGSGIHLRRSDTIQEIYKKVQRDPDLFLVAIIKGEIVGTVIGGFDGRRGMMYHLAVHPDFRNQGIGHNLVKELEIRLRQKGCLRYYLLVTKDNEPAIRFYEALGWEEMDLYIFGKDLV